MLERRSRRRGRSNSKRLAYAATWGAKSNRLGVRPSQISISLTFRSRTFSRADVSPSRTPGRLPPSFYQCFRGLLCSPCRHPLVSLFGTVPLAFAVYRHRVATSAGDPKNGLTPRPRRRIASNFGSFSLSGHCACDCQCRMRPHKTR
jgi:hypothetical protein